MPAAGGDVVTGCQVNIPSSDTFYVKPPAAPSDKSSTTLNHTLPTVFTVREKVLQELRESVRHMSSAQRGASSPKLTPEVEPITSMLLHPLLQDPKFLAAVLAVTLSVILYSCK